MDWSKELQRPRPLPRGVELDRRVKLAKQGDKLAALEAHSVLAADLRRGTLDARERELLASMHEAVARGTDPAAAMLLAKPSSRPVKTRMHEFIADWVYREIEAGESGKETVYQRAGEAFGISASSAKRIYLGSLKPSG